MVISEEVVKSIIKDTMVYANYPYDKSIRRDFLILKT